MADATKTLQQAGAPVITALDASAEDDGGWNLAGSGHVSAALFGNALQVWSRAQGRPTTVNEAALAFNVAPALIREAVEAHYWMALSGNVIEHEGE